MAAAGRAEIGERENSNGDRRAATPEARKVPWTKVGYGLTAAWMVVVLGITGNDVTHPLFDYIFSVPLAVWAAVLALGYVLRRLGKS